MQLKIIAALLALLGTIGLGMWSNHQYHAKLEDQYQRGVKHGTEQAQLLASEKENKTVLELNRQLGQLIKTNEEIQSEKAKLESRIASFVSRDFNAQRLRDQALREFQRDLQTATTENLRRSAEICDGNFTRSREHVKRFGLEAAECSRTAEVQRRDLDNWQGALDGSLPQLPPLPDLPK
jgi:hypothetical protein